MTLAQKTIRFALSLVDASNGSNIDVAIHRGTTSDLRNELIRRRAFLSITKEKKKKRKKEEDRKTKNQKKKRNKDKRTERKRKKEKRK